MWKISLLKISTRKLALSFRPVFMEVNGLRESKKRDNVVQDVHDTRYIHDFGEFDPWTAWAYKPRTISLLFMGTCFLIWASGALDPESTASHDMATSVKRDVWAMIAVFLAYSLLQAPSTKSLH